MSPSSTREVCDQTRRNSKIERGVECKVEAKRGSLSRRRRQQNTGQTIYAAEVGSNLTFLH